MSSSIPPTLQGSQGPSGIELLWEKHRTKINLLLVILVAALAANYGYQWYDQNRVNDTWGSWAVNLGLDDGYSGESASGQYAMMEAAAKLPGELSRQLAAMEPAKLEAAAKDASSVQRPYFLWSCAYSAFRHKDYAKAEACLDQLADQFPKHVLVTESKHPIQFQPTKVGLSETDKKGPRSGQLESAEAGTAVGELRKLIASAQSFQVPAWEKPSTEGNPRVEIDFGDYGKVVFALMPEQAPKIVERFKKLIEAKHWDGVRVDQIQRPGDTLFQRNQATQLHFGLMSTKGEANRDNWVATKPSEEQIDYEPNDLSHFPGAVAAEPWGQDKVQVDRLWINVTDNVAEDQRSVVFGYVVDGMDVLKKITDLSLATETEQKAGKGKPAEFVTIQSVTLLP